MHLLCPESSTAQQYWCGSFPSEFITGEGLHAIFQNLTSQEPENQLVAAANCQEWPARPISSVYYLLRYCRLAGALSGSLML
mmetsp:Transcript_40476/g.114635  ORF Transcript_40476/g.114635 Transcript_40476/m.114635 type:complete len:82 (-) Transcript_40476:60-305(-)